MSQIYLNGPSVGRSMSAEEFARAAERLPDQPSTQRANDGPNTCHSPTSGCGCGCTAAPTPPTGCCCGGMGGGCPGDDCPGDDCRHEQECCCQQMICCCRPAPCPAPKPEVDEGCCCKQSFRAALGLLCDQQISSLLDFDTSAFLTDTYVAGSTLTGKQTASGSAGTDTGTSTEADDSTGDDTDAADKPKPPTPSNPNGPSDNLGTLTGSFRRFAPCTCDLLDINAELSTSGGKDCGFTATQVSLCKLDAVVIQAAAATSSEGDLTATNVTARNFRCLRQRLAQRLNPCGSPCGQEQCSCACDGRDCCCAAGLLDTLARNNLSRRVSLVAGLLVLQNVTLLGTVGNVLVLSNDTDNRLYFVCVNSIQFIG